MWCAFSWPDTECHSNMGDCFGYSPAMPILNGIAIFLVFGRQPLLMWHLILHIHEMLGISTATVFNSLSRRIIGIYVMN